MSVKVVCAWCQVVIRDGDGDVSHSICERCAVDRCRHCGEFLEHDPDIPVSERAQFCDKECAMAHEGRL